MKSDETRKLVAAMRRSLENPGIGLHQENMAREQMAQAADALEEALPEGREGRCWCPEVTQFCWYDNMPSGPKWLLRDSLGQHISPSGSFCPDCGAELGADGIARRNADAARVERVRAELDASEAQASEEEFHPLRPGDHLSQWVADDPEFYAERVSAESVRRVCKRIRAAIYGPQNPLQAAAASTERRLAADLSGYRDAEPGIAGDPDSARPADVTPGEPTDTARLDALERMVAESAARGERSERE